MIGFSDNSITGHKELTGRQGDIIIQNIII